MYRDRVSIGNIGYETTGSNKVNALPSRDCIHVWGTTAKNWNFAPNTIFEERSYSSAVAVYYPQAVAISKEPQKIGCFGIVVSPFHGLNGLEDDDKTHSEMIRNRINATESEATIQTKKPKKTVSFASSNMFFEDNDKSIRSNPITIIGHSYRKVPTEEKAVKNTSLDIKQTNQKLLTEETERSEETTNTPRVTFCERLARCFGITR